VVDTGPYWTDVVSAVALIVQVAIVALAAAFAWRQVGEARRLREEQTRPFVVIDFAVERHLVFLEVANIGTTLASDVRFQIEPSLGSSTVDTLDEMKMLTDGIRSLAPRKTIRTLFDTAIARNREELPDSYSVTVRYSDETRRRCFEEVLDLDLGIYWNLMQVERRELHDVHERLKDVLKEMKKWTSGTGRGILLFSPDEVYAENERRRRYHEERRAARADSSGEESSSGPGEA
jgi:hypothetical protein